MLFPQCDYLICESTYGDRLHEEQEVTEQELVKCKNCKHRHTMEDYMEDEITSFGDDKRTFIIKPVCDLGDDGWCCRGEKKE